MRSALRAELTGYLPLQPTERTAYMRIVRLAIVLTGLFCFATAVQAAPLSLTLAKAPCNPCFAGPEFGDVLFNGTKIGEYILVTDSVNASNLAALTLSLFFFNSTGGLPIPITLQGVVAIKTTVGFTTKDAAGSISASAIVWPGLIGSTFTLNGATGELILQLP